MAHKTEKAAVDDLKYQQDVSFRGLIVWRKDWLRWQPALMSAVDIERYDVLDEPVLRTKNQFIVAWNRTASIRAF